MKQTQRGASATVIVVVIALILIVGGYLAFRRQATVNNLPDTNNATSTVSTSTDTTSTTTQATSTASTGYVKQVKIYLYAPNDNGMTGTKFGCGDSLVPVTRDITPTQSPLKAALETLFSIKTKDYGQSGLQTVFDKSSLKVDSASVVNGTANVKLSGSLSLGGVCDDPRVQAQLEGTVKQFATVKNVNITLNGKPLSSVLSEKGE